MSARRPFSLRYAKRLFALLLVGFTALLMTWDAKSAWAQAAPVVELSVESATVGLGEAFDVQLVAQAAEMPRFPELELPRGLVASRPSVGTSTNVSIVNGVRIDRLGVEAHWQVRASETGTFTIGPATVRVGDRVLASRRITVRVVREAPRDTRRRGAAASPFDPFGFFGRAPIDPFGEPKFEPLLEPETDPAYAMDRAPQPGIFLAAKVDKASAILGEQVTHTVLLYADTRLSDPQFTDLHEAPAAKFLRHTLLDDAQPPKLLAHARVGEAIYRVYLLRKVALFPLAAGKLEIGGMRLKWLGTREGDRASNVLEVRVGEAPARARPAGYVPGTVGSYAIGVEVAPRTFDQGGTFVVKATVDGRGQGPSRLVVPESTDLEWLEPDVSESFAAEEQAHWGGRRTFTWAVRVRAAGQKNLGKIGFVTFDPRAKTYARVEAELGSVVVRAVAGGAQAETRDRRGLDELPAPIANAPEPTLEPVTTAIPRRVFLAPVALVAVVPLAALLTAILRGMSVLFARFRQRKPSFRRVLAELEAEAKRAEPAALEGLTVRVVEALAAGLSGGSVRGLRDDALARVLAEALPIDVSEGLAVRMREARDARFSGLTSAAEARTRFEAAITIARKFAGKVRS